MTRLLEDIERPTLPRAGRGPEAATRLPPVAILAGGLGTRLAEETAVRPKPLVEIGGNPVIWHVMNHYAAYGMTEFVIALGYMKEAVIRYFLDLYATGRDVTVRTRDGSVQLHDSPAAPDWTVHLVDTGPATQTGGRIKRLRERLGGGTFMLTWCDGLSNVDLTRLLAFHRSHGKLATMTVVRSPSRFGIVEVDGEGGVRNFREKPAEGAGWINGAFFVLEPGIFDYIDDDATAWEREPLERLVADGELHAWRHDSFWQCMDTLREKKLLEDLWSTGKAPWRTWE
jgi:glucose-1-phosphate cytidylyltransferase